MLVFFLWNFFNYWKSTKSVSSVRSVTILNCTRCFTCKQKGEQCWVHRTIMAPNSITLPFWRDSINTICLQMSSKTQESEYWGFICECDKSWPGEHSNGVDLTPCCWLGRPLCQGRALPRVLSPVVCRQTQKRELPGIAVDQAVLPPAGKWGTTVRLGMFGQKYIPENQAQRRTIFL